MKLTKKITLVLMIVANSLVSAKGLPVGTVLTSLLTESQFQSKMGAEWRLMSGGSIEGTALAKVFGAALPDARGKFLRMANNGIEASKGNPQDKKLGEFQDDALQRIHGAFGVSNVDNREGAVSYGGAYRLERGEGVYSSQYDGRSTWTSKLSFDSSRVTRSAPETRAKNITVNFFVKVEKCYSKKCQ